MNAQDHAFVAALTTYLETVTAKGMDAAATLMPTLPADLQDTAALAAAFQTFAAQLHASHEVYTEIADGNLDVDIPRHLYLAMPAKALQASLKHLTWQTARIAEGDLNHTVHFLGEFSTSFNQLVDALRAKHRLEEELLEYQRSLHQINVLLEQKATTDSLTGLRNRQYLDQQLILEISRAERYQTPVGFILFDIDHFKAINDSFGHLAGDEVLKTLADTVSKAIRNLDVVARWGGEEFAIILPGSTLEPAVQTAGKLRALIEACNFPVDRTVTCSFGVSQYRAGDTPEKITGRADDALYAAKAAGRNRVVAENH